MLAGIRSKSGRIHAGHQVTGRNETNAWRAGQVFLTLSASVWNTLPAFTDGDCSAGPAMRIVTTTNDRGRRRLNGRGYFCHGLSSTASRDCDALSAAGVERRGSHTRDQKERSARWTR